jgi:hypothetical protein
VNYIPVLRVKLPDNYPRATTRTFSVKVSGTGPNGIRAEYDVPVQVDPADINLKVHTVNNQANSAGRDSIVISSGQSAYVSWGSWLDGHSVCHSEIKKGNTAINIPKFSGSDIDKAVSQPKSVLLSQTLSVGTYTMIRKCTVGDSTIESKPPVTIQVTSSSFRER